MPFEWILKVLFIFLQYDDVNVIVYDDNDNDDDNDDDEWLYSNKS